MAPMLRLGPGTLASPTYHKENPQNQKPKFGENGSKVARPATRPTPYKL